jgi:hypothetical protein
VVVGLRGEVRFFGADDVRESAYSLTLALPPELF